jgi:hypothetical protein
MNPFESAWLKVEDPVTQPSRLRNTLEVEYRSFLEQVYNGDQAYAESLVDSLYAGDAYLIRNAFTREYMLELRDRVYDYWTKTPSSFHKTLEGVPNFHRIIDPEAAKNYTFKSIRHSCYFFPWNEDPLNLWKPVLERWRLCKYIGGLDKTAYEGNTPKDGIVDRIQIANYPAEVGVSETHSDPWENQRLIISAYMSKRGEGYHKGGFYYIGKNDEQVDFEDQLEIGDMVISYATVYHGVATVDPDKKVDWDSKDGRWWLGLYSISSDEVKDRAVGRAVSVGVGA